MDWKQEMMKRLDALADKFGTTGAYLWHVLVKQGIAEGIADLVLAAFLAGAAVAVYYIGQAFYKAYKKCDCYSGEGWITGAIISWVVLPFLVGCAIANTYDGVLTLMNPEYFALHQVLQVLGK